MSRRMRVDLHSLGKSQPMVRELFEVGEADLGLSSETLRGLNARESLCEPSQASDRLSVDAFCIRGCTEV